MNKSIKLSLFLLFISALSIPAWSQKVGLLMDSYVIDRWYLDQRLFQKKVEELGGQCLVEVPYGDVDEQVKLGKKLVDEGIDVLVMVPTDAKKAVEIVGYAKSAGVPVISYDRLVLSDKIDYYISYDNLTVGKMQAQYAVDHAKGGNYLLINGPTSDNNAILFREGQLEALQPYIKVGKVEVISDVVLDNWSELEALIKIDEIFANLKKKPDAIIAANDALARGTMQALPPEMLKHVLITGQDAELEAIKYIISGKQSMTIYKPIQPLAFKAAEIAMMLGKDEQPTNEDIVPLKNGDITVNAILLTPVLVDKTNYRETVVQDGHISLSEVMENK